MSKVIAEIKGNKYTETEIDNMLIDYINIGENIYKRRTKVVQILIKNFTKKYRKYGVSIIGKKKKSKTILKLCKVNVRTSRVLFMQ